MLWKTSYVSTYVAWEILVHKICSWSKWLFKHLFYEVHFSSQWLIFFIYFYISFNQKKKSKNTWTHHMNHTLLIVRLCKIITLLNGWVKHIFILKMSHTWKLYQDNLWCLTGDGGIKTKQPQFVNTKTWILQAGQAEPTLGHLERISSGLPSPVAEAVTTGPWEVVTHWAPC